MSIMSEPENVGGNAAVNPTGDTLAAQNLPPIAPDECPKPHYHGYQPFLEAVSDLYRPLQDATPMVAAFAAGRLWNRLRFHWEQAWFYRRGHLEAAERAWITLGRAVRNLVPPDRRDQVQLDVHRQMEDLWGAMGGEEHAEYLNDLSERLGRCATWGTIERARASVLAEVFEALELLRQDIEASLEGPVRLAWRLGILLDQGVCPPTVYPHRDDLVRPSATGRRRVLGRQVDRPDRPSVNVLVGLSRWPGDLGPEDEWLDGFCQALVENGLHETLPWELLDRAARMSPEDSWSVIEELDAIIRETLAGRRTEAECQESRGQESNERVMISPEPMPGSEPESGATFCSVPDPLPLAEATSDEDGTVGGPELEQGQRPSSDEPDGVKGLAPTGEPGQDEMPSDLMEPGYLGLLVDPRRFLVRRVGREECVDLSGGAQLWRLLLKLLEFRGEPWHRERIRAVWETMGTAANPEAGTIDAAMSKLNGRLRTLGVMVRAARGRGWQLLDINRQGVGRSKTRDL
jgi:hypothetical protein